MIKYLFATVAAFVLAVAPTHTGAQCGSILESCAKANPGAMAGFTLVDAAYDQLDAKGGKLRLTLFAGNTYRFLSCKEDKVQALVMALSDAKGNVIADNMTDDKSSVFKMMEVNCTATGEYMLILLPFKGEGCGGFIYALK
jgi:hypothetical protein